MCAFIILWIAAKYILIICIKEIINLLSEWEHVRCLKKFMIVKCLYLLQNIFLDLLKAAKRKKMQCIDWNPYLLGIILYLRKVKKIFILYKTKPGLSFHEIIIIGLLLFSFIKCFAAVKKIYSYLVANMEVME